MAEIPIIQLALDYVELPAALAMAQMVHKEVEVIEIGTPLTKAEGMNAVAAVRELCPDNIILADVKSPDVGGLEAKICFDAGADWMTVLGAAPLATVELALQEANSRPGKEAIIELTGIRDILARAREWRSIGMERMVYHRGWDEGNASRLWEPQDRATIQELIRMGFKISVAGGLGLDMISFFDGVDISVFIIGRAIRETADPAATARLFRAEINKYYGGNVSSFSDADQAAKAIRWGISEMGLMLTVDGRDCPGCDAPGRFCPGTSTEIMVPQGIDGQLLVNQIAAGLDASDKAAVGWSQPGAFHLDVAALQRINTPAVVGLLATTGLALNRLGHGVESRNALNVAQSIMNEFR